MVRYVASSLLAAIGIFGLAEQAGAVAIGRMLTSFQAGEASQFSAVTRTIDPAPCSAASRSAVPQMAAALIPTPAVAPVGFSKSAALLGGAVSALDRIRMVQAGQPAASAQLADAAQAAPAGLGLAGAGLAPGAAPFAAAATASFVSGADCGRFALPRATGVPFQPGRSAIVAGSDDFLQTRRLAVSRTAFDQQWRRVSAQGLSARLVRRETGLGGDSGTSLAAVTKVNAWANRRIRFVEDAKLFRAADYWAPAPTTLRLGAGDCEDIAVTKLQALAALGVPRSDIYLTIARDLARGADHAMLVVRVGGRFWLLDNSTDRLLDAQESYDYQPVLSFSQNRKWLHGGLLAAR